MMSILRGGRFLTILTRLGVFGVGLVAAYGLLVVTGKQRAVLCHAEGGEAQKSEGCDGEAHVDRQCEGLDVSALLRDCVAD